MASHVAYEIAALEFTCQLFVTTSDRFVFEAFLLHARAVRDFFWLDKPKPDDTIAAQFVSDPKAWLALRGDPSGTVDQSWLPINKQLAHLTWVRTNPAGFVSLEPMVLPLAAQLLATWTTFLGALPPHLREVFLTALEHRRSEVRTRVSEANTGSNTPPRLVQLLSKTLRVRLVDDIARVFFFAQLAARETRRVGIDISSVIPILLFLEDRRYYEHRGISSRAILRALASILGIGRRSGGSTITQQLARTLLIRDWHKTYRRKIIEMLLALWLERLFSKDEILEMYLSSVRFGSECFGIASATKRYLGRIATALSRAQSFLLVERISTAGNRVQAAKIDQYLREAHHLKLLQVEDIRETVTLYRQLTASGTLRCDSISMQRLANKWIQE